MKTTLHYKAILILLIIPIIALGNNNGNWKGKHTKEKTITKEFSVNSDATLKIDNSYGNIDISTWDENRIVIEVHISTNGNNQEKVQNKLDQITIDFNATSNLVSAKTRFKSSRSWWSWGGNTINMKINYTIKMPITNNVELSNDYGNINLDKLEGRAIIDCDYGKITTKELMAENNIITFDYTNHSYFEYIKSAEIDADYSSFTVGKTNNLKINADYSKAVIEIAENVSYDCDYGSLTIHKVNNVTGDADYLTLRIGDVYKNVQITADYGSLKIDTITENAGDITIDSDYMKITIGYASNYNFNFELNLDYASFRDSEDLEFTKKHIKSRSKYYEGYYGSTNSGNLITITSDYGSVTLNKN